MWIAGRIVMYGSLSKDNYLHLGFGMVCSRQSLRCWPRSAVRDDRFSCMVRAEAWGQGSNPLSHRAISGEAFDFFEGHARCSYHSSRNAGAERRATSNFRTRSNHRPEYALSVDDARLSAIGWGPPDRIP